MNRLSAGWAIIFMILGITFAEAQISPGDLTSAHAHLEGISNCTQCHDIGNQVPDQKCLACHDKISTLINEGRGYHSSEEVRSSACIDCHSEHHGRKFDMMRFDQETFEHQKAGYVLEGQHAIIDCRDCHMPDFIEDPELKERKATFLGLDQECLTCHEDQHQGSLSANCASCHDYNAFQPATYFDHDEADFALKGKHLEVDCIECHPIIEKGGQDFQQFAEVAHGDCIDCHEDVHQQHFVSNCTDCHIEEGFERFVGDRKFNHDRTGFTLKGRHRAVDCFSCHQKTSDPLAVFQDQLGVEEQNCVHCHEDVHDGKFGRDCAQCHNEESFVQLNSMDFFNHDLTDFPLVGKHIEVDCKECHTGRYTEALDFAECRACHSDFHEGQFASPPPGPDCASCHQTDGFEYTTYGIREHAETDFPLEGAHLATPCFACHLQEEEWVFVSMSTACVSCHEDMHKEVLDSVYYQPEGCASCHSTEGWASIHFNHDRTQWPLEGSHQTVGCAECHFQYDSEGGLKGQLFAGTATACAECHENIHGAQFAENGITDCTRCHLPNEDWYPELFDHDQTEFPLEGRHAEIDCAACHETLIKEGEERMQFKMESFECIDCHL